MASFVPLHASWCWFKMKARARKVPKRARVSDEERESGAPLPDCCFAWKEHSDWRSGRGHQSEARTTKAPQRLPIRATSGVT